MARIRSIHPEQWTDDQFVTCSPLARLLALGIRNESDDNGIFEWNSIKLKMRILPADNCNASDLLAEIEATKQVMRFEVGGKQYGMVRNFQKYQKPKKPTFYYPVPGENLPNGYALNPSYSGTSSPPVPHQYGKIPADGSEGEGGIEEVEGDNADALSPPASPTEGREDRDQHPGGKEPTPCPHDEIIALYHEALPMCPRVRAWNKKRQSYLRQRWRENPERQNLEWWRQYFTWVSKSKFLIGQTLGTNGRPPFIADLEWLINESNMTKVIEAKYHQDQAA